MAARGGLRERLVGNGRHPSSYGAEGNQDSLAETRLAKKRVASKAVDSRPVINWESAPNARISRFS